MTTASAIGSVRLPVLAVAAATIVLAAFLLPPVAQPLDYHRFADARTLVGVPNFWSVVSNIAILAAGIAGLRFVLTRPVGAALPMAPARWPYAVMFAGFALTAVGSAYYHWAPDNARLVWDRLPMTIAFMALLAVFIGERISVRAGSQLLAPLVLIGAASVFWWQWTMTRGADDVGPYVAVQFGSVALVLLIAALYPPSAGSRGGIFIVALWYVAAKLVEIFDERILAAGGMLSGHTLKHLLVGAAGYQLLRMAKRDYGAPPN